MNEEITTENIATSAASSNSNQTLPNQTEKSQSPDFIPETPEGYLLPESQTLPFSEEADKSFKELAHKLKLTTEQVRELGAWANEKGEYNIDLAARHAEKVKADSMTALKAEWGLNLETNMDKAVRTAESLAQQFPEFKNFLDETGAGSDPRFIKTMAKIGDLMSEDSLPYSAPTGGRSGYIGSMPVLDFSSMEK